MKSRNLSNNKVFIIITLTKKLTKKNFYNPVFYYFCRRRWK